MRSRSLRRNEHQNWLEVRDCSGELHLVMEVSQDLNQKAAKSQQKESMLGIDVLKQVRLIIGPISGQRSLN